MTGCRCKILSELRHGGLCCETSSLETSQQYETFYTLSFIVKFKSNLLYNKTSTIKILLFRKGTVNAITDKLKCISDPEWSSDCVCVSCVPAGDRLSLWRGALIGAAPLLSKQLTPVSNNTCTCRGNQYKSPKLALECWLATWLFDGTNRPIRLSMNAKRRKETAECKGETEIQVKVKEKLMEFSVNT